VIRFDYGSIVPWVTRKEGGVVAVGGPDALSLSTPVETEGRDFTTVAEFDLTEGERVPFVLEWYPSHQPRPAPIDGIAAVDDTEAWWAEWVASSTYKGPWSDAVTRSLVTLKALTYAPTGGIVAAPTTSLPEAVGGVRNW